jgi:hypothetical protein
LNRRTYVPAPERGHVLKSPNQVIQAYGPKQKQIQGKGGGTYIAVP